MLNLELFFLGKLRKHREFIISPKLSFQQRSFWDSWFNRCHVDNKLTPFLVGKKSSRRVWLFLIKQQNLTYIGIATNSEDLVGRDYPFLVFTVISSETCLQDELTRLVLFFQAHATDFENWVVQGQMDDILSASWYTQWANDAQVCDRQTDMKNDDDLQAIIKVLYADYQTEPYVSNWYDIKSTKIVIHPNTLTCSLYNKIFG